MDDTKDLQNNSPIENTEPPQEVPQEPLPDIEIPALRTYKSDINRTVNQDKITTAKILIAEQKLKLKQQIIQSETSVKKPKNMIALIFGILFLVSAVGLVGYFGYEKIINQTPIIAFNQEDFFLFAFDKKEYIDSSKLKSEVYDTVKKTVDDADSNKDNTYTDIIFYKTESETNTNLRISSAEFFNLYQISLPSVISRSISKDFVYGLYKTGVRVEPFLVIGLADYENAYDSMFDWERTLALDLRELFPKLQKIFDNPVIENLVSTSTPEFASSTATSTTKQNLDIASSTATSTFIIETQPNTEVANRNVTFTDVVLSNKDTRAVRDSNGTPYFFYAFIEKDKILFAQDPKLITEIVRKIKEKQLVR